MKDKLIPIKQLRKRMNEKQGFRKKCNVRMWPQLKVVKNPNIDTGFKNICIFSRDVFA
jgi:hypothetical protein